MKSYLEFESDIKGLEEELDKLKDPLSNEGLAEVNTEKINQIQNELDQKLKEVYSNLNRWQKTLVARHEERPRANFFINNLFFNFINFNFLNFFFNIVFFNNFISFCCFVINIFILIYFYFSRLFIFFNKLNILFNVFFFISSSISFIFKLSLKSEIHISIDFGSTFVKLKILLALSGSLYSLQKGSTSR